MSLNLVVSLILVSLSKEYDSFVQNYNMHGTGKTVNEFHAMLKLHEQTLLKKDATPALHAIRAVVKPLRVGHLTRDYWSSAATNNQRTLTCYECGNQGHFKSDCPKLKNRNHGNQAEGTGTHGMVLAFGGGETDQDLNNIEDEIEA
ncbi:putative reverse transcriptase domain-containing protein [Tanacetum coccineum]